MGHRMKTFIERDKCSAFILSVRFANVTLSLLNGLKSVAPCCGAV